MMAAVLKPKYIAICYKQSSSFTNKRESGSCLGVVKHTTWPTQYGQRLMLKICCGKFNLSVPLQAHTQLLTDREQTDRHVYRNIYRTLRGPVQRSVTFQTLRFVLLNSGPERNKASTDPNMCSATVSRFCLVYPQQTFDMGSGLPVTCVR